MAHPQGSPGGAAARHPAPVPRAWHPLVAAAGDAAGLDRATDALAERLAAPGADLGEIAPRAALAAHGAHRRMVVAKDAADAAAALASRDPQRVFTGVADEGRPVVFLFPGLGEQYPGMARGLYRSEPAFRAAFDRCADALGAWMDGDLRDAVYPAVPETEAGGAGGGIDLRAMLARVKEQGDAATKRLNRTAVAQPAVFVVEYALGQLLLSWGIRPSGMIGHSLGEYAAAATAGVLPLDGALELVARRAAMIEALPGGAMLAVPLSEADALPFLGPELAIGAVNAPSTCVVSGPEDAVAGLEARMGEAGHVTRRLPTTHAFHSPMMEPILEPFAAMLRGMRLGAPELPFVSNVTGTWIGADEARDPGYWGRHLTGAVRFSDGIRVLAADERAVFVEVGPGQTLGAFARQAGATRQIVVSTVRQSYNKLPDTAFLLGTVGRLWLAGAEVRWEGVFPAAAAAQPAAMAG